MTTGRVLSACRLMATRGLFGAREVAQGACDDRDGFPTPIVDNRRQGTASAQPTAGLPSAPGR
jgi:hypothetical protein